MLSPHIERIYQYDAETLTAETHTIDTSSGIVIRSEITFAKPRDVIFVRIPKTFEAEDERDVAISVDTDTTHISANLDMEGDERALLDTDYFVEPIFVPMTSHAHIAIRATTPRISLADVHDIVVTGLDSEIFRYHIQIPSPSTPADNIARADNA